MSNKSLSNIAIIIAVISLLLAGFFFGKSIYNKPITIRETVFDTLYVYRDTIMADIEAEFIDWESISNSGIDPSTTLPTQTDLGISYEIAKLDTTFTFSDSTWHRLKIEYDEFRNQFFLDSKFRVYEAIDTPSISNHQPNHKTPYTPFLTASWAFGKEDGDGFSVLGIGVGIKYKKFGIGAAAFSNKTAGGIITYEF